VNDSYFAQTGFSSSEWHVFCHLSIAAIYGLTVMMVVSKQLSVDILLIQELHGFHNSDICYHPSYQVSSFPWQEKLYGLASLMLEYSEDEGCFPCSDGGNDSAM
jgi:hypothetical protein